MHNYLKGAIVKFNLNLEMLQKANVNEHNDDTYQE